MAWNLEEGVNPARQGVEAGFGSSSVWVTMEGLLSGTGELTRLEQCKRCQPTGPLTGWVTWESERLSLRFSIFICEMRRLELACRVLSFSFSIFIEIIYVRNDLASHRCSLFVACADVSYAERFLL